MSVFGRRNKTKLLLDRYPGAVAAYSLKKLRRDYRGPCIRLRKRVGGAADYHADFGFRFGELDWEAVQMWLDGTDDGLVADNGEGRVAVWYSQCEYNNDAVNTISGTQPFFGNKKIDFKKQINTVLEIPHISWYTAFGVAKREIDNQVVVELSVNKNNSSISQMRGLFSMQHGDYWPFRTFDRVWINDIQYLGTFFANQLPANEEQLLSGTQVINGLPSAASLSPWDEISGITDRSGRMGAGNPSFQFLEGYIKELIVYPFTYNDTQMQLQQAEMMKNYNL